MWNLQISPFGQNDNTGGSNEKYGIFVQALYSPFFCNLGVKFALAILGVVSSALFW